MTVIVWKAPYLASDSRVTEADTIFTNKHQKIYELKNGGLFGSAGDADDNDLLNLINRLKNKSPTHKQLIALEFEFVAIVVNPDGHITILESAREEESGKYKAAVFTINEPYVAIGSGADVANGALAMGASAEQAVKMAIKHNNTCGGAVQKLKLDTAMRLKESKET